MMAANYFLKHITKLHPGWVCVWGGGGSCTEGRASNVIKNVVFSAKKKELVKN
jgi:hypothetical protein